jgi:Mg-chelatase subunit ChlD
MNNTPLTHIYFLLDRSGSMATMASDVIGGFNSFLADQINDGDDAVLTLIQFDSTDPHEVLTNATPLREVAQLSAATFLPRGGTPLYDAMGHAIADAKIRLESVKSKNEGSETIIFVTFTDGEENRSVEYTREDIFRLVDRHQAEGWTFVFLGANQDAYAAGGAVGIGGGSTQNFRADGQGSTAAFESLSKSMMRERAKMRVGAKRNVEDFFEGDKDAEQDLRRRR